MSCATYSNDDLELDVGEKTYKVSVEATASYYYSPGRMYMRNGDPGYPEEEELEIESVDATWYEVDEDGNETEVNATPEMISTLDDYLNDLSIDAWSLPEPDDYYDEEPDDEF